MFRRSGVTDYISSDANDRTALTPAHFVIGDTLTSSPDYDFSTVPIGRLSGCEHVQGEWHVASLIQAENHYKARAGLVIAYIHIRLFA